MMPAFPLLVFLAGNQRIMQLKSASFFWPAVFLLTSFVGFASLYPDPGIFGLIDILEAERLVST